VRFAAGAREDGRQPDCAHERRHRPAQEGLLIVPGVVLRGRYLDTSFRLTEHALRGRRTFLLLLGEI
jgi:hypothetical protein